jgi:hypothetical protein
MNGVHRVKAKIAMQEGTYSKTWGNVKEKYWQ